MPPEIIPSGDPTPDPNPQPTPDKGKALTCEGCGSRVDRHGNLLRRGDRLREALDAEDTIVQLRKQLEKATSTITEREATIAELRTKASPERKSLWKRDA